MISTNFTLLNDSLKTFILSVAVGEETVIDKLLATANKHLDVLDSLQVDTPNVKFYFETSVQIINNAYTALRYINSHSADLFSNDSMNPLDTDLEAIEERFTLVLNRIRKEVPNVR